MNDKIKSDYSMTGKLYPKLDAYYISKGCEKQTVEIYIASSCQLKTQKKLKASISQCYGIDQTAIKIVKGE